MTLLLTSLNLSNCAQCTAGQENRRLVGHFYDMKNQFWVVGCGLDWAVGKKVWANYEQLLKEVFSIFSFSWPIP
jgi:hypothetical protein